MNRRSLGCLTIAVASSVGVPTAAFGQVRAYSYPSSTEFSIPIKGEITAMAVSPGGNIVYLAGANMSSIFVVNIESHRLTQIPLRRGANVTGVAVTPDGREIYVTGNGSTAAGWRRTLYVVNAATNRLTGTINVGGSSSYVAFSPDGRTAYVGVVDGLDFIDVATQKVRAEIPIEPNASLIAINPNGQSVYVVSDLLQVIDVAHENVTATFATNSSNACGVTLNAKGTLLYESFCSALGTSANAIEPLQIINTRTNTVTSHVDISGGSRGIALSANGRILFTASDSQYGIDVIDARRHSLIGVIPVKVNYKYSLANLVEMSPSGRTLFAVTISFFGGSSQFSAIALPGKQ